MSDLSAKLDNFFQAKFAPDQPGASVLVALGDDVIFRRGYGLANLELGVPVTPDMVFRIGSITKQFTATAILTLIDAGQLALDDSIVNILPGYPIGGDRITVEHLLTHTSGITNYTDLPEWPSTWRKDFAALELVDLFKNRPLEFEPGERFGYSNSNYHLLGAIIEKVSGQSYETFLRERILDPLELRNTCYDTPQRLIPLRASGYEKGPNGYTNAEYLSMTHPYAGGALASTVDDLWAWTRALACGRVLRPDSLQKAWTPARLNNGSPTFYGYGWWIDQLSAGRTTEHGGGIHGFTAHALYLPDKQLFTAVLHNCRFAPVDDLALTCMEMTLGISSATTIPVTVPSDLLASHAGIYRIRDGFERLVTFASGRLYSQITNGEREELLPISATEFAIENHERLRLVFGHDETDGVAIATLHMRFGFTEIGRKISEANRLFRR